jgi:hypothetical protein
MIHYCLGTSNAMTKGENWFGWISLGYVITKNLIELMLYHQSSFSQIMVKKPNLSWVHNSLI